MSAGELDFDFSRWQIVIEMPAADRQRLKGTAGDTWPNLILPELVQSGVPVTLRDRPPEPASELTQAVLKHDRAL